MSKKTLLTIILSVIYFIIFSYFESQVLSPLILDKDYCYYHTHKTPFLIELLYMSPASNGHPDGSFFLLFIILIISISFSYLTINKITKKFSH